MNCTGFRPFDEPWYFHINAHHCQLSAEISRIICSPMRNSADSTRETMDGKRGSGKMWDERARDPCLSLEFHKGPWSRNRYQLLPTNDVLIFSPCNGCRLLSFALFQLPRWLYSLVTVATFMFQYFYRCRFQRKYLQYAWLTWHNAIDIYANIIDLRVTCVGNTDIFVYICNMQ